MILSLDNLGLLLFLAIRGSIPAMKIIEVNSPVKLPETKNHNYLTVLKNKNNSLSNEIMKGNDLIIKLRKKIVNHEQEKKNIIL